ncbi:TPA: hypothetical protein MCQ63_004260 [Klebsiella pneumoniae]|nr:hypothetical protein K28_19910 [Klebsiella pneumoniae]KTG65382.1 hypothetical protein K25_17135 [Klebsiella pneumoniae]KTG67352.1 hypothetical protein K26_24825 [Klebsiella pneumoniae]MDR8474920.1 hypothetical protein [Klebsiella pneumoniae]MDR8484008.1 hypothetical protein [Klebsiella pneumoniae]
MAHHTTERFLDSGKRWSSFGKRWQTGGPFLITFIYILLFFNRKKRLKEQGSVKTER